MFYSQHDTLLNGYFIDFFPFANKLVLTVVKYLGLYTLSIFLIKKLSLQIEYISKAAECRHI